MGRPRGSEGYNKDDTRALLDVLKEVVPNTPSDWDVVLEKYRLTHATPQGRAPRDVDSLRNKFRGLIYRKDDTGVSVEVQRAREVQAAIKAKGKGSQRASLEPTQPRAPTGAVEPASSTIASTAQRPLLATTKRVIQAKPEAKKRRVSVESREQEGGTESASSSVTEPSSHGELATALAATRPVTILPRPVEDQRSSRVSISELTQLGKRARGEQAAATGVAQTLSTQEAAPTQVSGGSGDPLRFLEYLLALEKEEKANERQERQLLAQKLERVEKTCSMLREKMDDLRENNKAIQLDNLRLQGELSTLRAVKDVQRGNAQQ